MTDNASLVEMANDLYMRLGGFGSQDGRIVRALLEERSRSVAKIARLENAVRDMSKAIRQATEILAAAPEVE